MYFKRAKNRQQSAHRINNAGLNTSKKPAINRTTKSLGRLVVTTTGLTDFLTPLKQDYETSVITKRKKIRKAKILDSIVDLKDLKPRPKMKDYRKSMKKVLNVSAGLRRMHKYSSSFNLMKSTRGMSTDDRSGSKKAHIQSDLVGRFKKKSGMVVCEFGDSEDEDDENCKVRSPNSSLILQNNKSEANIVQMFKKRPLLPESLQKSKRRALNSQSENKNSSTARFSKSRGGGILSGILTDFYKNNHHALHLNLMASKTATTQKFNRTQHLRTKSTISLLSRAQYPSTANLSPDIEELKRREKSNIEARHRSKLIEYHKTMGFIKEKSNKITKKKAELGDLKNFSSRFSKDKEISSRLFRHVVLDMKQVGLKSRNLYQAKYKKPHQRMRNRMKKLAINMDSYDMPRSRIFRPRKLDMVPGAGHELLDNNSPGDALGRAGSPSNSASEGFLIVVKDGKEEKVLMGSQHKENKGA